MQIQPGLPARSPQPAIQEAQQHDAKLHEAASDFEALLIAQLLQSFRGETENSSLGGDAGASSSTMMEYAHQQLAQVMSRQGGLGLHEIILQGLLPKAESAAVTQTADGEAVSAPTREASALQLQRVTGIGKLPPSLR